MALPSLLKFPGAVHKKPQLAAPDVATNATRCIIDIGSNSVRLVAYAGPDRAPAVIFNEKVMAGLGRSLAETGSIDTAAMDRGLAALSRFAALSRQLSAHPPLCVATAAVRDASNGPEFLDRAAALGLSVTMLSGEQEAEASGYGVISGIPDANGIVADLGGGSLELVRVGPAHGLSGAPIAIGQRLSLPIGVLRLPALMALDANGRPKPEQSVIRNAVRDGMKAAGWKPEDIGLPVYLVGGSWRALARLDMHICGDPLPVMHQHVMANGCVNRLKAALGSMDATAIKSGAGISNSRIPHLAPAAELLGILEAELAASAMIISSTGLREGLLYRELPDDVRTQDPLLVAAQEEGRRLARFPEHGHLIDRWIAPLFPDDQPADIRLRQAACLLADIAWSANPGFRAERGVEVALHGSWLGATMEDRYRIAQALHTAFGGGTQHFGRIPDSVHPDQIARATAWGLAIRVGQRFSGGVADPLKHSSLAIVDRRVVLQISQQVAGLAGEAVARRLRNLAIYLGLSNAIVEME